MFVNRRLKTSAIYLIALRLAQRQKSLHALHGKAVSNRGTRGYVARVPTEGFRVHRSSAALRSTTRTGFAR